MSVRLRIHFTSKAPRQSNGRVRGNRFVKVKLTLIGMVKVTNPLIGRVRRRHFDHQRIGSVLFLSIIVQDQPDDRIQKTNLVANSLSRKRDHLRCGQVTIFSQGLRQPFWAE